MKKTSCMSKDSSNLSKPHFGRYFHFSLVFWGLCMICEKVKVLCLISNI